MLLYQDIVVINKDYLAYLYSIDSRVMINHENRRERPNVAVLLDNNGQKWAIPLSHSIKQRDSDATYNLFNEDNQSLGHLKFNNMIPLVEGTYTSAFNTVDLQYKSLLVEQEAIINKVFEKEIVTRFQKVHSINKEIVEFNSKTDHTEEEIKKYEKKEKFYSIFNDLQALQSGAEKWDIITNMDSYIDTKLKNSTSLKGIKVVRDEFKQILEDDGLQEVLIFRNQEKILLEKKFQNLNKYIENKNDGQREM